MHAHKSYNSNNFKGAISEYEGVLHCEWYDYKKFFDEFIKAPFSEIFFIRRMKFPGKPDGFTLYGKLGVDFFATSDLFYPNMKIRRQLIRAGPNFYMISDNPNLSPGIDDCSLYTRRIAPKNNYDQKRLDMLAYTPVEFNYMENVAKTFIIPARQDRSIQEKFFNNVPVGRIAIAMKSNSAFTASHAENFFLKMNFQDDTLSFAIANFRDH